MSSAFQSPAPRQLAGMAEEEGEADDKMIVVGALDAEEEIVDGADEEVEETDGGWDGGGGGGHDLFLPPPGFRFAPTEDEMIRYYLLPKLQGMAYVPKNAIIEDSVYQCHPDGLTRKYMDRGQGRSWYFLSPRERKYKNGDLPRRDTKDLRGRWKASTGKRDEGCGGGDDDDDDDDVGMKKKVAGDGTTRYCKSVLAYFYFRGRGAKEKKSGVPEYEIKLPKKGGPGGPTLDRYAMYKIYPAPKNKGNDDDEAGPSNAEQVESDDEVETAELPPMLSEKMTGKRPVSELPPMLSEKMAGKRPVLELPPVLSEKMAGKRPVSELPPMQLCNPAAAKKKRARHSNRLQIEPPAPPPPPPQGNGMQAPFRMTGYCDGSGQAMGYQAGAPMPLPLVPYNNGQVHVPRQQAAYNGQVPMMTPQPAAYNGQMPGMQQQAAYNGQVPMMTPQPAAYNGQMPGTQQQAAYNGQVPMMTPQPAAYNGQMPGTQQQGAYNGQVPIMTRQPTAYNRPMPVTQQQVAFNGLVRPPPYRPVGAPNNHGQYQTMMTRPSCPAGQAVNPPPVAPQMQRQPETDEMLEKRVLQQNLEEYLWMQQQEMAFMVREQQQLTMALMMQQERQYHQNQPYPGANADCHHHAGGNAPQFSLDDFYASVSAEYYERSRAVLPATSGSPGEAAPVKAEGSPVSTVVYPGASGDSNNGNHDRAESAAVKASPGGSGGASAEGGTAPNPNMVRPSDRCSDS